MTHLIKRCLLATAMLLLSIPASHAGVIMLTGSDADVLHGHGPYALDTRDHLQGGSALDVLVLGSAGAGGLYSTAVGGVGVTTATTLAGLILSNYSAIYLLSNDANGTGCCEADVARIAGFEAAINAFIGSGGSFGVQDYTGSAGFDAILGTAGGANGSVYGFLGGLGGTNNYDNEAVTAAGTAAGFQNYAAVGAWGHQGFDMGFFSGLGYTSLIDAPVYGGTAAGLISKTVAAARIPEPGTLALLSLGLFGMGLARSKRKG